MKLQDLMDKEFIEWAESIGFWMTKTEFYEYAMEMEERARQEDYYMMDFYPQEV